MIFGINNDWFSPKRNLERLGYCFSYIRKHGWERFCTHMYVDIFPVRKCTAMTMFFRGIYSLYTQSPTRFTLKTRKVHRLIKQATAIDIIIMYATDGGGVRYIHRLMNDQPSNRLTFVIRSAECANTTVTEVYENNKIDARFISQGLSIFHQLPAEKCATLWINDLPYWNFYGGAATMSAATLNHLCDEILELRTALDMRMRYLMHNFYPLCPRATFINAQDEYCGDNPTTSDCTQCLGSNDNLVQSFLFTRGTDITHWRLAGQKIMVACDEVRCFSDDTKNRVLRLCPNLTNLTVVPHNALHDFRKPCIAKSSVPTIGVFGSISALKGLKQVLSLSKFLLSHNSSERIIIVGSIDNYAHPPPNITITGPYNHKDLPRIVEENGINIAFFSSICPETFSYVTQELIMLGLPIVCFNIGAQAERVSKYEYGRIAKSMCAEDVWAAIQETHAHFMKATA